MKKKYSIIFLFIIISVSILQAQSIAEWHTSMGNFKIMLREDLVPITTNNFIDLTNSNYYDDLIFHRVIIDFMIQDGCPLGTGYGGPGYSIPDEFHDDLLYNEAGVIGMANAGPNTGGSQYFITVVPTPWLNYGYSAFGNVIEGFEVVEEISEVATSGPDGNPPNYPDIPVVIDSIRIVTPQLFGKTPEQDSVYANQYDAVVFAVLSNDEGLEYSWYVNDVVEPETSFLYTNLCMNEGLYEIKSIVSNGEYEYPTIWYLQIGNTSSDDTEVPLKPVLYQNIPNPFNPETTITFSINTEFSENTELIIYNLKGQRIRDLSSKISKNGIEGSIGSYSITWNGRDDNNQPVHSGIYLYSLNIRDFKQTKKMLLLK